MVETILSKSVSVVVATFNAAEFIENCILSVLCQTFNNVELIVIDGGSSDKTLDILKKYQDRIRFISEADRGISDAHSKGVQLSLGEWIYFLGADDLLASPMAFEKIFDAYRGMGVEADIITGHVIYDNGRIYKSKRPDFLYFKNTIHHQGAIYRSSLLKERDFDKSLKIYYDYDFNLWAYFSKKIFRHTAVVISLLGTGGVSDRPKFINYLEDIRVRARYVRRIRLLVGTLGSVARYFYKVVYLWCFGIRFRH